MLYLLHAKFQHEDLGRTSQEVQARLRPEGHGDERSDSQIHRAVRGEGRKETETINPHGAGPPTATNRRRTLTSIPSQEEAWLRRL
jgi:hypothetical protein